MVFASIQDNYSYENLNFPQLKLITCKIVTFDIT